MDSIRMNRDENWLTAKTKVFWGEIAACDHVVQIYEDDEVFINLLSGFVEDGFHADDCVVVIATKAHLELLRQHLLTKGFDVISMERSNQYIPLNARETLSKFMVHEWPDENLFVQTVTELILKAKRGNRQVRAFGEMVALLWADGQVGATVRLEQLWNKFCQTEAFCLFCAYPKSGFTQDASESLLHICGAHSKMIDGSKSQTELFYRSMDNRNNDRSPLTVAGE